ncbi:MAG TPA: hypothetical protein VHO84_01150, partial [Syntrophorhabdaceae bacterium]|nr:hypothetical protein [Syntrophorhabdaceae bacterium]
AIAVVNALREIGDRQQRLDSIAFFHSLFGDESRDILLDIRHSEEDQMIINTIDELLAKQAESA